MKKKKISIELKFYKQFYRTGELVKTTVILFLISSCHVFELLTSLHRRTAKMLIKNKAKKMKMKKNRFLIHWNSIYRRNLWRTCILMDSNLMRIANIKWRRRRRRGIANKVWMRNEEKPTRRIIVESHTWWYDLNECLPALKSMTLYLNIEHGKWFLKHEKIDLKLHKNCTQAIYTTMKKKSLFSSTLFMPLLLDCCFVAKIQIT